MKVLLINESPKITVGSYFLIVNALYKYFTMTTSLSPEFKNIVLRGKNLPRKFENILKVVFKKLFFLCNYL